MQRSYLLLLCHVINFLISLTSLSTMEDIISIKHHHHPKDQSLLKTDGTRINLCHNSLSMFTILWIPWHPNSAILWIRWFQINLRWAKIQWLKGRWLKILWAKANWGKQIWWGFTKIQWWGSVVDKWILEVTTMILAILVTKISNDCYVMVAF